jgi:hypothetical protein
LYLVGLRREGVIATGRSQAEIAAQARLNQALSAIDKTIDDGNVTGVKYVGLEIRAYRTRCHGSPPFRGPAAFRLQARGLEDNVPPSLRVELDAAVPVFRPVSQPIKYGHGRSAAL